MENTQKTCPYVCVCVCVNPLDDFERKSSGENKQSVIIYSPSCAFPHICDLLSLVEKFHTVLFHAIKMNEDGPPKKSTMTLLLMTAAMHLHLHLPDAFIQSNLSNSGYTCFFVSMCSLGIEPTTFAPLTQCSTTEPQEHNCNALQTIAWHL